MVDTNTALVEVTKTHPHVATIVIDPARWHDFERTFGGRPEVKVLKLDHRTPDVWTAQVACASKTVRDLLEANW
jgi:hypothetical protein